MQRNVAQKNEVQMLRGLNVLLTVSFTLKKEKKNCNGWVGLCPGSEHLYAL